ncbi:MAG TPA: ATP-binding protein [Mycobacteriales bacterium]|nr:ATP-binding protein [Mycobacteriales bacterium]
MVTQQADAAGSGGGVPGGRSELAGQLTRSGAGPGQRWLVGLGALGVANTAALLAAVNATPGPDGSMQLVSIFGQLAIACLLLVAPWAMLAARRLGGDPGARRMFGRAGMVAAALALLGAAQVLGGLVVVLLERPGAALAEHPADGDGASPISILGGVAILAGGVVALVGMVLVPWLFVLVRRVVRERSARVRAEERAEMANHLHDSVLQALTLIQKGADEPAAVVRLARRTERELRAWLYGAPTVDGDDLRAALTAMVAEVEDQFGVAVELVAVGTAELDSRTRAVVGATREALCNAAKHTGRGRVSVFVEVGDAEILVLVRDRGQGFDRSDGLEADRRGIAESIVGRMRRHGGTAEVRSVPGAGTEVELHMPSRPAP